MTDRAVLIHDATVAVYRAAHCARWGADAQDFVCRAADALDAAGLAELAERCREAVFNPTLVDGLLAELWRCRT